MNSYAKIEIPLQSPEQADILIALLAECGYEGFEEEEPSLFAFIRVEDFDQEVLEDILSEYKLPFSKQIIEQRNWNAEWESNFEPVVIGNFCSIRASFHAPVKGVTHELVITPKMSFGTGHHATTCLMIEAMEEIDFTGKSVFDFGTGTGVLSVLAEKLGAAAILAVDIDDWSIENSRENIAENHCVRIAVEKGDHIPSTKLFDILLANINKNVIIPSLPEMRQQLKPGGVLLLSGLLAADFDEVSLEAGKENFTIIRQLSKDNWISILLAKK